MVDMAFAKKVFASYEHFYVKNCGLSLEKVVALNTKQKKKSNYQPPISSGE